ncbi:uncharacterized protein IWZ02DRAFT_288506 [Phyllosticta citriasiana]|uniref:uncharacterized protein n=1 Tax=Phyllosticta citriasiana TaxID=595635 RepID=UPI0030FD84E3
MTSRPPSFDDFNVESNPQTASYTPFVLVALGLVALRAFFAHHDTPLRAVSETLWNILVYIMPSPLVFALGQPSINVDEDKNSANMFAAKNEVLRRVFGLDGLGMLKAISGERALRSYGTMINTKDVVPPGLGNWDNSCYQNSVIQGLASLPSLRQFLVQSMTSFDGLASDSTNGALLDTVQKLNNPENHGRYLWTPAKLKNMSSWQQQDAQEYFSKVLDEIDREVLRASRQSRNVAGLENVPVAEEKASLLRPSYSTFPESLRNPLEGLLAQRVGCMSCGHTEGLSMIPFNCLTVPLQKDWGFGCDIRDCLNEYTKLEPIEGVECASCTLLKAEESLKNLLENAGEPGSPQMESIKETWIQRLQAVQHALGDEDFSDNTVLKKCHIPRKNWVQSTKSRQAVIGRPPKALVIHVNRSVFDEMTGVQRKNHAHVSFPEILDIGPWSLGSGEQPAYLRELEGHSEVWSTNPSESMISSNYLFEEPKLPYQLRAVVSHYGRHENGHYVCYRKHPFNTTNFGTQKSADGADQPEEVWWRLSDEDVSRVSKEDVLAQDGVFMLFYEAMPPPPPRPAPAVELTRRSSTSTIRAVASAQSPVGLYSPVEEGEDEEGEVEEVRGRWASLPKAEPIRAPMPASVEATIAADRRCGDSDESTPEVSEVDYAGDLSSSVKFPSSHSSQSSRSASPDSQPSEHDPSLEDTIVLEDNNPKKHSRDRNSTISVGSSNRAPTPLSPFSNPPMSPWDNQRTPLAGSMQTPYASQAPFSFNEHPASPIVDSNPLFDGLNPNSPIAEHGVNLDPAMRRVIEETIQQEEGGARWSTSRSEYAPSTVGGTESEYAPSSASIADSDVSDIESEGVSAARREREREDQRPQSRTSNQSQGLAMRTAGATKGEQGEGKIGLEGGFRMVTAT